MSNDQNKNTQAEQKPVSTTQVLRTLGAVFGGLFLAILFVAFILPNSPTSEVASGEQQVSHIQGEIEELQTDLAALEVDLKLAYITLGYDKIEVEVQSEAPNDAEIERIIQQTQNLKADLVFTEGE